jgi:DNA-binding response OmpR family regulator
VLKGEELIARIQPNIIILDADLPDENGYKI